jgi:UDP-N-acetylmuramate--alanine ligase
VIAVCQPHRYTRLGNLMEDFATAFNDADVVYISPVYAAGEAPIEGVSSAELVGKIKRRGHHSAQEIESAEHLAKELAATTRDGDLVVCLGAGDITKWAAGLADAIKAAKG